MVIVNLVGEGAGAGAGAGAVVVGVAIVKVSVFDVPPLRPEVKTVILAVPVLAMRDDATVAFS